MKKLLLIAVLAIGTTFLMSSFTKAFNKEVKTEVVVKKSPYERGWKNGFCDGWRNVKSQFAYCPDIPDCPTPEIDCNEGYKCGYKRGFKAGIKAARK